MRHLFTLLTLLLLAGGANAGEYGLMPGEVAQDTLVADSSQITGQTIDFPNPEYIKGSLAVWGHVKRLSGDTTDVAIYARLVVENSSGYAYGPWQLLGTIPAATTSQPYYYPISRNSWYGYCKGYQLKWVLSPDSNGQIEIRGKGAVK